MESTQLPSGKNVVLHEPEATNVKQVIVMRPDLKMRRGKQIAQGAHASIAFLTSRLQNQASIGLNDFSAAEQSWILGSFDKVCVRCNSEEELMTLYDKAVDLGLIVHLITDSVRTEFDAPPPPARVLLADQTMQVKLTK